VACNYEVTGQCTGMLTPERYNTHYKAFNDTKLAGINDDIIPTP